MKPIYQAIEITIARYKNGKTSLKMIRYLIYLSLSTSLLFIFSTAKAQDQTVTNGSYTVALNFPADGCLYEWANNTPGIGLGASGSGNISAFKAINTGSAPVSATITATPVSSGFGYITNLSSNDVSVISTANNSLIATVAVGRSPWGVSVSPDGSRVYVANIGSNSVSVISTASNTVIATVPTGNSPMGVAVSPDGSTVYATNSGAGTVSIINAASNVLSGTIPVGAAPNGITISPDGSKVYVANSGSNTVSVISALSRTVTATVPVGSDPLTQAVSPDGKSVYVTNQTSPSISVINATTNTVVTTLNIGSSPAGVVVSPNGLVVYVADPTTQKIYCINTATNAIIYTISVPQSPQGLSVNPDGSRLYATDRANGVTVINTATNSVISRIAVGAYPVSIGNFITPYLVCNGSPISATITVNPSPVITTGTLTGSISACEGSASSIPNIQQFPLSGHNLSNGITVTAPAGFEVSLKATDGYSKSLVVVQSGGILNATMIYVRSAAAAAAGNISGDIKLVSGASTVDLTVKATVNKLLTVDTVANQTVSSGAATNPVNFSGTATNFTWVNNNPSIGLVAAGTGNIPPFTAFNPGSSAVTAKITVTPVNTPAYAYITNDGDGTVSVINISTGVVVETIPVGPRPFAVAVTADGSRIYVTDEAEGFVSVIDGKTNRFVSNIFIPNSVPLGIAVSPDGSRIYVTINNSNYISVINTLNKTIVATITTGNGPRGVCVSRDGNRVYVANQGSNNVSVIDAITNTVIDSIKVDNPYGIKLSHDGGRLYVTNAQSHYVTVINTNLRSVLANIPVGMNPTGVAVSPDDSRVYVANEDISTVSVINAQTLNVITTVPLSQSAYPIGVSVTSDGSKVYVACQNGSTAVISTATNTIIDKITTGLGSLAFGSFITSGDDGCTGKPVSFTITVNPAPEIKATGLLNAVNTTYGTSSASSSFFVSATNLATGIIVTPPPGFEVSADNLNFSSIITIAGAGNFVTLPVYIRLAAVSNAGNYSGNILLSSKGAGNVIVAMPNSTVERAPLTITATDVTKIYGSAIVGPATSTAFTVSGGKLQNGNTIVSVNLSYGTAAAVTAAVGTYPTLIPTVEMVDNGFLLENYHISYVPGNIIVRPAPLTITADNKTKTFGAINPVLTVSYAGFVNNESIKQLTSPPVIFTSATTFSPAGDYVITVSGASALNYAITYVMGILTINPLPASIAIPNTFTPNGDGINDVWNIPLLALYNKNVVNVYNRYGQLVFHSAGYGTPWDGTYKGSTLAVGAYYYIIQLDDYSKPLSGEVTIIR